MKPVNREELKILFMGTSGSGSIGALRTIAEEYRVVGVVDNYERREKASLYDKYCRRNSVLRRFCGGRKIPYLGTMNVNSPESEDFVRGSGCNLICVCSAHQLMKENIIGIPRYGVMNAHGALLPDYRGANPTFYIFLNEESEGG